MKGLVCYNMFWNDKLPNIFCSNTSQNAQLRAITLSLQTAWTGFDPNLYSGGSSSAGPALVEIATARSFYTQQGHFDWHNACHTPGARMVCSAFHSTKAVVKLFPKWLPHHLNVLIYVGLTGCDYNKWKYHSCWSMNIAELSPQ